MREDSENDAMRQRGDTNATFGSHQAFESALSSVVPSFASLFSVACTCGVCVFLQKLAADHIDGGDCAQILDAICCRKRLDSLAK